MAVVIHSCSGQAMRYRWSAAARLLATLLVVIMLTTSLGVGPDLKG